MIHRIFCITGFNAQKGQQRGDSELLFFPDQQYLGLGRLEKSLEII